MKSLVPAAILSLAATLQAVAADLRDPMRPPGAPDAVISRPNSPASLQLQAVIGTGGSRVAIVDGKVARVGDTINSARISEISADHIVYVRGGKQLVASLPNTTLHVRTNKTLQAGQP